MTIQETNNGWVSYRSAGVPTQHPILLLHGFPDNNRTMDGLMTALAGSGWYAVAPALPGYLGSAPPEHHDYGLASLAGWVDRVAHHVFSQSLSRPVLLGHDWGAAIGYVAAALYPNRWSRLIALSVPPPLGLLKSLVAHPIQMVRSTYMMFFQLPALPDWILSAAPIGAVEHFWRKWSPGWEPPKDHIAQVAAELAIPEVARAALGYYRHLIVRSPADWPRFRRDFQAIQAAIGVPTKILTGETDQCIGPECFENLTECFSAPFQVDRVPAAGHFVHLEAQAAVLAAVVD